MTITIEVAGYIGTAAALIAAIFWLRVSLIEVPDIFETFIGELQRIGRWNSAAAMAATVAAICAAVIFFQQISTSGGA